ncbi:phenoloxidase-activating factor 3-like [Drosophila miranda]|uniref:phenoloxidase-activating factor 3-like n=1 Tax=Drosophila miranda TaxID=7229 RepID=UPI00143FA48E|nr:phenoloxidase-activating factor 3-like [Drosophila miranda]
MAFLDWQDVLLWSVLYLLAGGTTDNLAENENCFYCVHIDECGKLFGILQQGKSAPFEEIRLIYKSGCNDYRGLFCCENDPKGIEELQKQNCGVSEALPGDLNFRVVNGKEVKLGSRPWMALFLTNRSANAEHFCGGSLITQRFVLSAAHCFTKQEYGDINSVVVRLGEHDVRHIRDCRTYGDKEICATPSEDFAIKRIISHEFFSYSSTTAQDSCRGDSGGPLGSLVNYLGRPRFVQFGLVSYGFDHRLHKRWISSAMDNRNYAGITNSYRYTFICKKYKILTVKD